MKPPSPINNSSSIDISGYITCIIYPPGYGLCNGLVEPPSLVEPPGPINIPRCVGHCGFIGPSSSIDESCYINGLVEPSGPINISRCVSHYGFVGPSSPIDELRHINGLVQPPSTVGPPGHVLYKGFVKPSGPICCMCSIRPSGFVYYPGYICYVINVDNIYGCGIKHKVTCLFTYIF